MKLKLLLIGAMLAVTSMARATYTPVTIVPSSYNADVIVESNTTPVLYPTTTATVDNGTNNTANTWFERGWDTNVANLTNGLPPAGTVVTAQDNANYSFIMPPTYTGPNGILIDTVVTNGTFTLVTPAKYTLLSFMGSGGNGGDFINVKINHQDGTSENGSFSCPDWFNGNGIVLTVGGRCNNPMTYAPEADGNNPRIYFRDVTLSNTNSAVTSVVISYGSGVASSHNDILGMSGAATAGGPVTPIVVTGYTYDFVVESNAPHAGRIVTPVINNGTNVWATTQTFDNDGNTGFTFFEKGHNSNAINNGPWTYTNPSINGTTVNAIAQNSGIPVHGTTFTNGDHVFTMAPDYTTNDVVWLNPTSLTNATITFATPIAASALSFLDAAGNGPVAPVAVVHHQDGTSETNSITIVDWFSGSTPAYIPNGRVAADTAAWSQLVNTGLGADRLFQTDLPLSNTTSPVTSIDLTYTNTGGRAGIFAVSALAGVVPPIVTQDPTGSNVYAGTSAQFTAQVSSTAPVTYQWQRGTNTTFVNVNNGGASGISGATTPNLNIATAAFADGADYRLVAANSGGSTTSAVATLGVFSTNVDVTQGSDTISAFNVSLFGDGPAKNAIDDNLGSKFGAGFSPPNYPGLIISPGVGPTVLSGIRIYTANDTQGRDPANYKLEGSLNGGPYTLIASNNITLPAGRNTGGIAPDPLTTFGIESRFANSAAYTSYRITFSQFTDNTLNQIQFGEIELLGVATNLAVFVQDPGPQKAFEGNALSLFATVTGNPTPDAVWQKQVGGVYVNLNDNTRITGSHSAAMTINPAVLSDTGLYRVVATNTGGAGTGAVVQVTVYSTNVDVTVPGDPITDFGNTALANPANPAGAIDDSFTTFVTRGSGPNNNAGFAPFAGPVGVVVTPAVGSTIVTGIRVYPGADTVPSDPVDVKLEGSSNGGASYTTLVPQTLLNLPDDRNTALNSLDPTQAAVTEINFANQQGFTSYRVTFSNTKDTNNSSSMSVGEIELLGVAGAGTAPPSLSVTRGTPGQLTITSSVNGTLQNTTNLIGPGTVWSTIGGINGTTNITVNPAVRSSFYRVTVP